MIIHPVIPAEVAERFRSYLVPIDDCLEWIGATDDKGYGQFWHQVDGISARANRFALYNGYLDTELFVLHTCDNPPCCKKEHLFQGTPLDNMTDKIMKGRAPDLHGERNGNAKLTNADVLEIRRLRELGLTCAEIARRFSVHSPAISRICTGVRRNDI